MTDVIMARIEAINNGELPEGYKRAKAGIMPEDWDGAIRAKQLFKSHTDKKHNGDLEILASTQERGIVPRSQIGIDIQCSDEGVKGYKKVSKGDFVISLRSFQGGIEYSEYDGIVSPAYTILKPINDISAGFYRNYFKTDSFIDRINGAVYGIRDGKQIGYEDFGDMYVHCPPLAEQERIAEILLQCDKVIQLKQRKIKELGHLKKACLRMMFPEKGCSKPVIRFPGFSEAWEQRKLGELIREISTGKSVNSDEGIVRADNIGVLKTSCVSYDRFDPSESKPVVKDERHLAKCAVEKDSVIVSRMNTPERVGACGYVERSFPNLFLPDRLWKLKFQENVNTYFLYTMLISGAYKEKITSMASGTSGSMYNIPKDAFLNLRLTLSLDIDEQKKIGDYFKQLDNLITLHQRELEESKKKKKALEKLLLTGIVRVHV